jgi:hypothetical protein
MEVLPMVKWEDGIVPTYQESVVMEVIDDLLDSGFDFIQIIDMFIQMFPQWNWGNAPVAEAFMFGGLICDSESGEYMVITQDEWRQYPDGFHDLIVLSQ